MCLEARHLFCDTSLVENKICNCPIVPNFSKILALESIYTTGAALMWIILARIFVWLVIPRHTTYKTILPSNFCLSLL